MVKKVLLVSFLTLALCFSLPTDKQAAPLAPTSVPPVDKIVNTTELHDTNVTTTKPDSPSKDDANTQMLQSTNITTNTNNSVKPEPPKQSGTKKQPKNAVDVGNESTPTVTTTAITASTKKMETTVAPPTTTEVPTPTIINITTIAPTTTAAGVTTDKPANATTVKPTAAVPVTAASTTRGFDGPSFIGGIILTLGLLACGFVGFKYYRNQTERNYHTL